MSYTFYSKFSLSKKILLIRPFSLFSRSAPSPQMDYVMPKHISPACQDLIRSLLVKNPLKRLGMGLKGMEELRAHPWFKGFNWQALKAGTMPAPYVPRILNPEDTHNFHKVRGMREWGQERFLSEFSRILCLFGGAWQSLYYPIALFTPQG